MFFFRESDAAIVRRTLEGHPEAFEPLVYRYQRKAHAVARASGLRSAATDDVVQEAFLQAFRDLASLRDPASFGPWFLNIVRHVAIKGLRRPPQGSTTQESGDPRATAVEKTEQRDFSEYLWRNVSELPEGVRETLFLYYYEGESIREVARALAVTGSAVKKRLRSGRDQLREKLWREVGDCLRDMLPSTRDWQKRARRLSLLLLGALPASLASTAASQAGSAIETGAGPSGVKILAARTAALMRGIERGGLLAGKRKLAALVALGLLVAFLGTGIWLGTRRGAGSQSEMVEASRVLSTPPLEPVVANEEAPEPTTIPDVAKVEEQPSPPEQPPTEAPAPEEVFGSVRVRVVWGDDRTPAAGLRGMIISWGSPFLYNDERTFTTGPDGTILVDRVFRGGVTVWIDRGGRTDVQVAPGGEREAVVEVPPGINVEGVVVDRHGFPVGGAHVWISYGGHMNWGNDVTTTAPDGVFAIRAVQSTYVAARADGHAASDLRTLKGEVGSTVNVRIRLNGESGAVTGVVRDAGGEPVPFANVMIGTEYPRYTLLEDGATGFSAAPFRGFADAEGGFVANSLAPGKTRVAVRAQGFAPFEGWIEVAARATAEVDVNLETGGTLTGRVTGSNGQPASGVQVVAGEFRDFLSVKLFSSGNGSYRLQGLPAGEVEVYAARPGWGRAATRLTVHGNELLRWDPVLAEDREITGRVLDQNGASLPGFLVLAEAAVGKGARRETQTKQKTDAEGRFRIPELSDIVYRLLVFEPESPFPCLFADDVRPESEEVVVQVERDALSSAFVFGRIVDPAGKAAPGAKVLCFSAIAGHRAAFAEKERGEFQIGPIPPGRYRLEVQAQGYPPVEVEEEELDPHERHDAGVIWLKPLGQ